MAMPDTNPENLSRHYRFGVVCYCQTASTVGSQAHRHYVLNACVFFCIQNTLSSLHALKGLICVALWGQYIWVAEDRQNLRAVEIFEWRLWPVDQISTALSCVTFPANVGNTPTEILECEVPAVVLHRALWLNSEVARCCPGEYGQIFSLKILNGERRTDASILITLRGGCLNRSVPSLLGGGFGDPRTRGGRRVERDAGNGRVNA